MNSTGGWQWATGADSAIITRAAPEVALPIPKTEIDANPNMEQNPR